MELPALAIVGALFSAVGTIAQAGAMRDQAQAERNAANYKAQVENQKAMEERASAQRQALATGRKTALVQSQIQARAAASGGGADDPSVISLASGVEREGSYQSLYSTYLGESRGRGLEDQAVLDRYSGEMKASNLESNANATILGGFGSLFGKFGSRGFSPGFA